jgi:hypothetical protein
VFVSSEVAKVTRQAFAPRTTMVKEEVPTRKTNASAIDAEKKDILRQTVGKARKTRTKGRQIGNWREQEGVRKWLLQLMAETKLNSYSVARPFQTMPTS